MLRSYKKLPVGSSPGGGRVYRHSVALSADPSPAEGSEGAVARDQLLREFVDTPALGACGPATYQKMTVRHADGAWRIYLEALQEEATS